MTPPPADAGARELAAHGAWLRRLARDLVRDADAAEELVQDTYVAALQHPPAGGVASMRAWLATIVRNLARDRARAEAGRRAREAATAKADRLEPEDETAARLESAETLIAALGQLAEPYRSTLVARYFDGRSAAEIARQAGVPAATVRWRLQRGLELVRAGMQARARGGRELRAGLALLARAPEWSLASVAAATAAGVLAMHTLVKVVAAVAVVGVAGLGWWMASEPVASAPEAGPPAVSELPGERAPVELGTALEAGPDERSPTARSASAQSAAVPGEAAASAALSQAVRIEARLLDPQGRPIAGGTLELRGFEVPASEPSGADGRVTLVHELPAALGAGEQAVIEVAARDWATRFERALLRSGQTTVLGDLTLEPGAVLAGLVRFADGRPCAGARVVVGGPDEFGGLERARRTGPSTWPGSPETRSDAYGAFELRGVAAGSLRLWAGLGGQRYTHSDALDVEPRSHRDDLVLVLEPLGPDEFIRGRVLDPDGAPVPHATLQHTVRQGGSMNSSSLAADGQGRFELRLALVAPHDFSASDPAGRWAPAAALQVPPGTQDLELRFQQLRTLMLAVVDARGAPVPAFQARVLRASGEDELEVHDADPLEHGQLALRVPTLPFVVVVDARGFALETLGPFDPAALPARAVARLTALPGLRGHVRSAGAPHPGIEVRLHRHAGSERVVNAGGFQARVLPEVESRDTSAADGSFWLTLREDGEYVILALAPAGRVAELGPFQASALRGASGLVVEFVPGGAIEGRVLTAPGRNPEGWIVSINRGDLAPRSLRVGADGVFRFDDLAPGEWQVRRTAAEAGKVEGWGIGTGSDATRFRGDCRVRAGEVTFHDLDLSDERPCTLSGTLTIDGSPAAGWSVDLMPASGVLVDESAPTALLDEQGRFQVSIANPGSYRAGFKPAGGGSGPSFQLRVELARGETPLRYDLATGRLEGRIADADQRTGLFATWKGPDEARAWIPLACDEQGEFALPRAPAGAHSIRRLVEQRWETLKTCEVRPRETTRVEIP